MTEKQFDRNFKRAIDAAVEGLADNPDVDVKKFYNLVYFFENLTFFSPVIYSLLKRKGEAGER